MLARYGASDAAIFDSSRFEFAQPMTHASLSPTSQTGFLISSSRLVDLSISLRCDTDHTDLGYVAYTMELFSCLREKLVRKNST